MSAVIYIEGGGSSKDLRVRCREGFSKLLKRCGFDGRMPKLVACGGRNNAFDDFVTGNLLKRAADYVGLLVDSEEPLSDIEKTWIHLTRRDRWAKPKNARDEQVLFMTTCMETWIISDRETLKAHFGKKLQPSALPPMHDLESRSREAIQSALVRATRDCTNAYSKGKRSFELLGKLNPETLKAQLPSLVRFLAILGKEL